MKKAIVLSDQHIPFHDKKVNDLLFDFIEDFKPDYVDLLGDLIDFWQISRFRKSPNRKETIQDDIDEAGLYLQRLRDLCPGAEITLHFGNHLSRLRKYIWDNANQLDCLRAVDLKVLLDLNKLHLKVIDGEQGFVTRGKLVLTHGTVVSQDSGMTARRNLNKYGMSVICGHTHRLGQVFKTDCRGTIGAWENGCLCNLDLIKEWGSELANWQQGFSLVFLKEHSKFHVESIPIFNNQWFMVGERYYEVGKKDDQGVHLLRNGEQEVGEVLPELRKTDT